MSLTEERRAQIDAAVSKGTQPNRQWTGRVSLPLGGNRYAILANGKGPTPAGVYYKERVGEGDGKHGLGGDRIIRQNAGGREFLQNRGDKKRLLRSIVNGEWQYTRLGTTYFQEHAFKEYVVSVPVLVTTYDGRQQGRTRVEYLPWSKFGANVLQSQLGSEQERRDRVIAEVKRQLGVQRGGNIIMEISGETYTFD